MVLDLTGQYPKSNSEGMGSCVGPLPEIVALLPAALGSIVIDDRIDLEAVSSRLPSCNIQFNQELITTTDLAFDFFSANQQNQVFEPMEVLPWYLRAPDAEVRMLKKSCQT